MTYHHIQDIFKDYLLNRNNQYALLINGTWGTGKTFFFESKLKLIAEEKKKKIIYISLNGHSSIDSIEKAIIIKTIPYLKKPWINTVLKSLNNVNFPKNQTV